MYDKIRLVLLSPTYLDQLMINKVIIFNYDRVNVFNIYTSKINTSLGI